MRKFKYGNTTISDFTWYDRAIAVIDTGSSLLGLPNTYYNIFMNAIQKDVESESKTYKSSAGLIYFSKPCN